MDFIVNWFKRQFANPQVVFLALFLAAAFASVLFFGDVLAPVLAGIVIAYVLEGAVRFFGTYNIPRIIAVVFVLVVFIFLVLLIVFGLLPLLSSQVAQLLQQVPAIIAKSQDALLSLPQQYPELISPTQLQEMTGSVGRDLMRFGQQLVSLSLASVAGLITFVIYAVLLPILVFFFLKDKERIVAWLSSFFPRDYELTKRVWVDVHEQIGNYIRGKFWEILIVGFTAFAVFKFLGLQYAILLSALVGISVLIPYIGAVVVTLPVLAVAWFQWGWGADFGYLMLAYFIIQIIDGNVLVPLLFSEALNLHPAAIIVAVLVFGGLWGLWGVFFAIPLATLVRAVIKAWPRSPATS